MTTPFKSVAAATLLMLLIAASLTADRLELRNGDVITGTIESMDETTIVVQTEYGLLEIDRSAVERGQFGAPEGEVPDALVLDFRFDGTLSDRAGNHVPTNNGMAFVADRDGNPGSALRSNGTGTYLSIAPTPELNALNEFTLVFRVQIEDLSLRHYLFSKWNRAEGTTADGKIALQSRGGNLTAYLAGPDGSFQWLTARAVLTEMQWHLVALSFAGGRTRIYVDGLEAASDRFEFTELLEETSPILIMTALSQTDEPFNFYNAVGSIDDLRLYSRELAPSEVELLAGSSSLE